MNTQLTYRGALALGVLALTLLNPSARLLAEACQDGDKSAKLLKRFDANQNGQLDPEEQKAADQSSQELFQRLHGKYDTDKDGDGRLNPEEKKAAQAERHAKKAESTPKKSGV